MCPYYMAIGMSYEEYWNCEPSRYEIYRKAHQLRNEQRNQEMWVQGAYFYSAIATALHNQPAFAIKPPKPIPYLEKPFSLKPKSEEEKRVEEQAKKEQFINYLKDFQKRWEDKHGR